MQRQGRKRDKSRRCWSMKEEEVLISALKDIIANGWKSENGFRTGYLVVLQRVMVKAFPGIDLRAQPHINSKLHVWKKYHASLTCMLAQRGFCWNAKEKMIKAQDDAWDLYLKVDSSARTMRYKSWPFYEDWCQIYGSDVPSARENIEDLADADQGIKKDTCSDRWKEMAAEFGYLDVEGIDEENELSVCHSQDSGTKEKQPPKKRKVSSNSMRDMIIAARLLVNRTPDMELFFSLPDNARAVMVNLLLADQL